MLSLMNEDRLEAAVDALYHNASDPTPPILNQAHTTVVQELVERCMRYREKLNGLRLQLQLASELSNSHNVHLADLYQLYQNELQTMREASDEKVARMQEQIEAANKRIEEALRLHEMQDRLKQTAHENELLRSEILRMHNKHKQRWTSKWARLLKLKK
jgi:hypothetical protein